MFVVFIVARTPAPSCRRDELTSFFGGGGPKEDPTTHWPMVLCNYIIAIVLVILSLRLSSSSAIDTIIRVVGALVPMVLLWWHVTEHGAVNQIQSFCCSNNNLFSSIVLDCTSLAHSRSLVRMRCSLCTFFILTRRIFLSKGKAWHVSALKRSTERQHASVERRAIRWNSLLTSYC